MTAAPSGASSRRDAVDRTDLIDRRHHENNIMHTLNDRIPGLNPRGGDR
jgi:hypothetical protein